MNTKIGKKKRQFFLLVIALFLSFVIFSIAVNQDYLFRSGGEILVCPQSNLTKTHSHLKIEILSNSAIPTVCQNSPLTNVVSFVHSGRANFRKREFIRKTWGQSKRYKNFQFGAVFVVGSQGVEENESVQLELSRETEKYNDIVVGDFIDNYLNMTIKHLVGYKWVLDHCLFADYVLKMDDDWMPNLFKLFDIIPQIEKQNYSFVCIGVGPENPAIVQRFTRTKWCMHKSEYAFDHFPSYCYGLGVFQPVSTPKKLYPLKDVSNFLWIDDVYVTGVLRSAYEMLHYQKFPILILSVQQYGNLYAILKGNGSSNLNIYEIYYFLEIEENSENEAVKTWDFLSSKYFNDSKMS